MSVFDVLREKLEEGENKRLQLASGTRNDIQSNLAACYSHAIEIVNQVEQEYSGGWIYCSDRLPKERDWYLAVFKEYDTDFVLVPRVADYIGRETESTTNEGWLIIDLEDNMSAYYKKLECIAWQPLPPKYEPKGGIGNECT